MYVIGKSTAIILFSAVAVVCVVLMVLEHRPQIETMVDAGTSLDNEAAPGYLAELYGSSGSTKHFRGRRRSLLDPVHPSPHHSGVHFAHNATSSTHKKAWMHYEEVDGLKNEEVVMFVMSSTVKDGYLLRERFVNFSKYAFKLVFDCNGTVIFFRVIAGARTWMKLFANVVVVIEGEATKLYFLLWMWLYDSSHFLFFPHRHIRNPLRFAPL